MNHSQHLERPVTFHIDGVFMMVFKRRLFVGGFKPSWSSKEQPLYYFINSVYSIIQGSTLT